MFLKKIIKDILITALLTLLIYSSCDIISPTEGVKVLFNEDPLTLVTIEVVDAKTQEQIVADLADSVQINIEGHDKDAIIDLTEKPSTFFTSHYGFFTFAIIDDYQVSPTNPVRITIVASSEGYITNSIPITLTSTQGETYTIALVQRSNPPEGSASTTKTDGLTDSKGAVKEDIVFTSDPEPNTKTEVTLEVTQGTIIKDEEGEVLTGTLQRTSLFLTINPGNL